MKNIEEFYTLKGYKLRENKNVTEAMEDYIEMIYRFDNKITVKQLSEKLNVKPSSVSKMIDRLKDKNLVENEKYGEIKLTNEGKKLGEYFLYRHKILNDFLEFINKDDYNLKQVEKIEHFVDEVTIKNLNILLIKLNNGVK
ncbi:MAG: MarR family transcriptional regulator [Bacilli bacterium]|nr:MarR family transcriptional regulator [Bacilli bacterium]